MITEQQLAILLEQAYDIEADAGVSPEDARRRFAEKQAAAIAQFVIGRSVTVTVNTINGVDGTGSPVTGTGAGTGIINT